MLRNAALYTPAMKTNREEVVLMFLDGDEPQAVMHSNGHHAFYRLKKMNREDVARLLSSEEKITWKQLSESQQ